MIALCGLLVGLGGTKKSPARGGASVIGSVREEERAVVSVIAKRTLLAAMDTPESGHMGRDVRLS